jgi:hypothetical protein
MNTLKLLLASTVLAASAVAAHGGTLNLSPAQLEAAQSALKLRLGRPIGVIPPAAGAYTFTLDSFRIDNTRSLFKDTDFVSISVAVGNNPPVTSPAKAMGDLDNGTFKVGASIPNVVVQPGQAVAFSYSIVNSGFNQNSIEQDLIKWIGQAAQKAAGAGAAALAALGTDDPNAASIANAAGSGAGGWAATKLLNIIFADCDGTVAAGDHSFSGAQLAKDTAGSKTMFTTDNNPGTDSPTGCGSNSRYEVTWSVHPSNVPEAAPATGVSGGGGGGAGGVGAGGANHHQED